MVSFLEPGLRYHSLYYMTLSYCLSAHVARNRFSNKSIRFVGEHIKNKHQMVFYAFVVCNLKKPKELAIQTKTK
ncbi:hypothetical protein SAMN04487906_2387 [Zhouia amylolytica]|uniref:Uncharacterized protein n=1 Tax=Zhouia amylolytica TaxID=376730 RepID=A0A1I6U5Y7_9FLAO|nr:hypothetical protein SAMN04487906_2387 [Zhouia amylolytica]